MREELRKYAEDGYALVEHIANDIGPRVPGSDEEKQLHLHMSEKLKEIGLKPRTEKFIFAPFSSIGGMPYAGWGGIVTLVLLVLAFVFGNINVMAGIILHSIACLYGVGLLIWIITSVLKYKTWLDWLFKQEVSHNTYAELVPEDGEYDYTIYLTGHTDTSWTLKHSVCGKHHPAFIYIKIGIGAVSTILAIALAFAMLVLYCCCAFDSSLIYAYIYTSAILGSLSPLLMAGCFMLCLYRERNPRAASPGAMDNATGVALAYETIKYFKENPDKMPKRCRIIDMSVGAEEAGLRGSLAFVRGHKDDGMLNNAYHINIDSIADKDFFEVISGDAWLCPHFDKELAEMAYDAMKESGVQKPGRMSNPVGGCDSTPFQKAGVKSITLAAQNPIMSNYYHTLYDVPERFDSDVMLTGFESIIRIIYKIEEKETNK